MEKRSSARRLSAIGLGCVLTYAVGGCHGTPVNTTAVASTSNRFSPMVAMAGGAFGDSIGLGVRVLSFDRANEQARITARDTKHLIVLAVVPGREIEVIIPGGQPVHHEREQWVHTLDLRRVDDDIRPADAAEDARTRLAYDNCMRQAAATLRRIEQQKARAVKRDSAGKIIETGSRGSTSDVDQERALQSSCDRLASKPPAKRTLAFLPPRAPADRYLVVLLSTSPMPLALLSERLATLTAVAPDVATTIEAIAAGVYVGVKGTWGGYFVAW